MEIYNPRIKKTQKIKDAKIKKMNIRVRGGKEIATECVEFTVIGRNNGNTWRDFLTLLEFAEHNGGRLAELINQ